MSTINMRDFSFVYADLPITFLFEEDGTEWIPKVIQQTSNFYEIECLEYIKKLTLPEGLFVDVGANIGNHSIFFSKIIGRKVLAFEAMPANYRFLCENLNKNVDKASDVRTYNFGLGDSNYFTNFEKPNSTDSGSYRKKKGCVEGDVEIRSFDDLFKGAEKERIAFMKIDVEGMELEVLKGAVDMLRVDKPALCIEIKTVKEYNQIYDYLSPLGYCAVGVFNATPTFIFEVIDDLQASARIKSVIRNFAIYYIKAKGRG